MAAAPRRIEKVLIANRGEIACRLIRTARALGYRTVAVASTADARARHARMADEVAPIGAAAPDQSYLSIPALIEAARRSGADAVHPGYGFLAENADFAQACAEAGLIFVGPGAEAMRLMGNKRAAKTCIRAAGIACVPGYEGEDQSDEALIAEARRIGFPLMVKAAAGGGGRGLRRIDTADALPAALTAARSEAASSFGSSELILEKALADPRHVEFQVLGDHHGSIVHLGERDCSVQRRHQKIIEEAPSPAVDAALRRAMGEAAVAVAQAVGYVNAGTVEFLLDADGQFYFLEMNTRLQVEHPVTEAVTGLDLVALQFRIAEGEPLPFAQDEVQISGHAVEARLYAEDPAAGFAPMSGRILAWRPAQGEGVRVDHGLTPGGEVTSHYDALLAKIIAHGPDREAAIRRLDRALSETLCLGPVTNRGFLRAILGSDAFRSGTATTTFVESDTSALPAGDERAETLAEALAASLLVAPQRRDLLAGWWSTGPASHPVRLTGRNQTSWLSVTIAGERFDVTRGDETLTLTIAERRRNRLRFLEAGRERTARFAIDGTRIHLDLDGRDFTFEDITYAPATAHEASESKLRAPMSGRIVRLAATPGMAVAKGEVLVVIEAMKMEHEIAAPMAGTIEAVHVREGDQVAMRDVLVSLAPASPADEPAS